MKLEDTALNHTHHLSENLAQNVKINLIEQEVNQNHLYQTQSNLLSHATNLQNNRAKNLFLPTLKPQQLKKQIVLVYPLLQLINYLSGHEIAQVQRAFNFSEQTHLGQYRHSGEPYITHPLAVAEICAAWHLSCNAICAALLHDVIEDQNISKHTIIEQFNHEVYDLVEGLTKLTNIEFCNNEEALAANFNKLLQTSDKNHRVLLIKIADRLHNMRTLVAMPPKKQKRIAKETNDVYAPLAYRLGLYDTYHELKQLSFRFQYPWRFEIIEASLKAKTLEHQAFIDSTCQKINLVLQKNHVNAQCFGTIKQAFMIYEGMLKQQKRYDYIHFRDARDLFTFKILVEKKIDCYLAMGLLHSLFTFKPGSFKDYIALPKRNGYQALHTTLLDATGEFLTVHIRSQKMEKVAKIGLLAFEDEWLNGQEPALNYLIHSLLELRHQTSLDEFMHQYKLDLQGNELVVFNEYAKPIILSKPSSVLDFAYAMSYDCGHHAVSCEVNHIPQSLSHPLKNGDFIKIHTSSTAKPSLQWLSWVKTSRAKSAIMYYLKLNGMLENIT